MAVDPALPPEVVDYFVKPHRPFFPSKIPLHHHQLRHLLSSPVSNHVYFSFQKDVYRIDVNTNKRTFIQELPFEPRCTATAHGYFCAGDEHGYFAFINIPDLSSSSAGEVDAPLPGLARRTGLDLPAHGQSLAVRVERLGIDIMNSISIHKLHRPAPGIESDIIAVLTNNDKVVRIFSLTREVGVRLDEYDFPMNHASISPDGQRIIAVGDRQYAYFYRMRKQLHEDRPECQTLGYRYEKAMTLPLHKPVRVSFSAYFTSAWSPSGKLCAVASEEGYITVFDVERLDEVESGVDPVVTVVPSSRPMTAAGAVRTMLFAPEPWDFLVWAENNGRVCVGDLRHDLVPRQVVTLDSKAADVERMQLHDCASIFEETDAPDPGAHDYVFPTGLSEHERQILEGFRSVRQREEVFNAEASGHLRRYGTVEPLRRNSPRSITYFPSARNRLGEYFIAHSLESPELTGLAATELGSANSSDSSRPGGSLLGDRSRMTQSPSRTASDTTSSDPWHTIEAAIDSAASADRRQRAAETPPRGPSQLFSEVQRVAREVAARNPSAADDGAGWEPFRRLLDLDLGAESGSAVGNAASSSATGVTLPSLRDLSSPPDASTAAEAWGGIGRTLMRPRGARADQAIRDFVSLRDRGAVGGAVGDATHGRHDPNVLRRFGVRVGATGQLRRAHGRRSPWLDEGSGEENGEGTTGVAIGEGGRKVYVGTEEGVFVLDLDFATRKAREAFEWC